MLPDGKLVRATRTIRPDVFFVSLCQVTKIASKSLSLKPSVQAALGAASSFGIIVSLELKAFKIYNNPVGFEYTFKLPTLAQAVQIFDAFQTYGMKSAPAKLSLRIRMSLPGNMVLQGLYCSIFSGLWHAINCWYDFALILKLDDLSVMMQVFILGP